MIFNLNRITGPSVLLSYMLISFSTTSLAHCNNDPNVFGYIPLIITAPASIAITAVGYTIDGAYYVGGPLAVGAAICIPIGIAISSGRGGGDVAGKCLEGFFRNGDYGSRNFGETDLGPSAYDATRSWRCPF